MKILIASSGTMGDVLPYLYLARALQQLGHDVNYIANPYHERTIVKAGIEFSPVGDPDELKAWLDDPRFFQSSEAWKIWVQPNTLSPMRETYATIEREHVPHETLVIAAHNIVAARIAQETLNLKLATIHLEPLAVRSRYDAASLPGPIVLSKWVPGFVKSFQYWVADKFFIDPMLAPEVNRFRSELGLQPVTRLLNGWCNSPDLIIATYPEWFYARQPDWPPQMTQTGFLTDNRKESHEIPEDLQEFLDAGEPPIVFCPGSNNKHAHQFLMAAVTTCRNLKYRGVLISKFAESITDDLPKGVRHVEFASFGPLFRQASAIVHHGGHGTAALALAHGKAQVVMPMTYGQLDTGPRLVRMGVAEMIRPNKMNAERLQAALTRLLASPGVSQKCDEYARKFRDDRPIEDTCQILEDFMTSGQV